MTRDISTISRNQLQGQYQDEVFLWFCTITHAQLDEPIRVVCEGLGSVSYRNGKIVNYSMGGNLYLGCPFKLEWITDTGDPPKGRVTVPDVERKIGAEVLLLVDSPQIRFDLAKLSDYGETFDSNNARIPIDTVDIEVTADFFFLQNVTGDAMQVAADLTTYDVATEPWPKMRATQDRLSWIGK